MRGSCEGRPTQAAKGGIEWLGLGFELCVKGAGAVCGNTTVG